MCGIAGIISSQKINLDFSSYLNCIDHRGPDNTGILYWKYGEIPIVNNFSNYNIALGHKRLSILDLSEAGSQPFASNDKRWWLAYNGEVYNYLELRCELESLGHLFHTQTDTEVILLSILEWGVDEALKLFQGMFSFALLDTNSGNLTLARDAFGIKPLYYCFWQDGFAFSSEMKLLRKLPGISKQMNPEVVAEYLINGACDSNFQTMSADIFQFPQASWQTFNIKSIPSKIGFNIFWDPFKIQKQHLSFNDAVLLVKQQFLDNIKKHLRSDVPFGVALSGGLDSSSIVCCIRHLYPDLPIHTFSYITSEKNISEENWVDIVNEHVGAIHHKIKIDNKDIVGDFDKLMMSQDEPFVSLAIYSQYRVFQEAKANGILVMLGGQGADELMGGYSPLQGVRLASLIRSSELLRALKFLMVQRKWNDRTIKSVFFTSINQLFSIKVFDRLRNLVRKNIHEDWLIKKWFEEREIKLSNNNYLCNGPEYLRDILKKSVTGGLLSLLRYEDRNSMAHSIESRVPFLTTNFAELVLSLPEEYLINDEGASKSVFREAMRGIVPDSILDRREKKGFASPDFKWLNYNKLFFKNIMESSAKIECINMSIASTHVKEFLDNEKKFSFLRWRLINFIDWYNRNKMRND